MKEQTHDNGATAPQNETEKKGLIVLEYHGKEIRVDLPELECPAESEITQGKPYDYEAEARATARDATRGWLKYQATESDLAEIATGEDLDTESDEELADELDGIGQNGERLSQFRLAGNWHEVENALDELGTEPEQELEIWRNASRADAYARDYNLRNVWAEEWETMLDAVRDAFDKAGINPDDEDDDEEPEDNNNEEGAE